MTISMVMTVVITTSHQVMEFILLLCHSQLIIDYYVCVCVLLSLFLKLLLFLCDAQRVETQEVNIETTNEYRAMVGLLLIIKEDSVLDMM